MATVNNSSQIGRVGELFDPMEISKMIEPKVAMTLGMRAAIR